jgi:4-amino-4-deoxy-L-arabinose transferase-like glycosyltransferase
LKTLLTFIRNNLAVLGICLLNLAVCLIVLFRFSDPLLVDIHEYTELAVNICNGQGYCGGGFFHQARLPSAFLQPVYAYLLAFFIRMSRLPLAYLHLRLLQIVFNLLLCLTVVSIGRKIFNRPAALWAGLIFALYLPFAYAAAYVWDTSLFSLQLAVIVWLVINYTDRNIFQAILLGLLLGLTVLTNSLILAVIPVIFVYLYFTRQAEWRRSLINLLIIAVVLVAVVAPWSIRNSLAFKSFVPVRTGFWLNLYLGNNEAATGTVFLKDGSNIPVNFKDGLVRHFGPMIPTLAKMNEAEQDHYFKKKFLAFVAARPLAFARLLLIKLFYYVWFNPFEPPRLAGELQYLLVLLLALSGFYGALKEKKKIGIFALVIIPFVLSYTVIGPFFNWKYRLPIEPYLIILAGYCLSRLAELLNPCLPAGRHRAAPPRVI